MADSFKDILITPNRSNTADPKLEFRGGNTTVNTAITITMYPDSNGTISFDGSAGQLFSITNDLSGLLWSVNDVSGIPSAEVYANGSVRLAEFSGNVSIGTATNSSKLFVNGNTTVNGSINVTSTAALGNTSITGFITATGANLVNLAVTGNAVMSNLEVTQTATINTNSIVVGTSPQSGITPTLLTLGGNIQANNSTGLAGQVLTTGGADANVYWSAIEESHTIVVSDETTNITAGAAKVTFRAPYALTLTRIPRASLSTPSSSGNPTVDINVSGASILSTKLSIDANEETSTTATTAAVLSSTNIVDDAKITIDIDAAGTGAKGLKITLYYKRTF